MSDYTRRPMRKRKEVEDYLDEAHDKVWLMMKKQNTPQNAGREEAIIEFYGDISKEKLTMWDWGYWNGVMAALRWMLGDERDFLDM